MARSELPPRPDPLPIALVDNHTHLDSVRSDAPGLEVSEAIAAAAAVGVDRVVQIGCEVESARSSVVMAHTHPQVLAGVALHPNEAPRLAALGELDAAYAVIGALALDPRVRTVGETGLDYYRTGPEGREIQHDAFRWHIALAKELDLPLQIHDRDAHEDVLAVLDEVGAPRHTVMHCFSGDARFARACVERGFFLSYAGPVTFKNNHALRDAVAVTPLEQLLIETDAPYLTPHPWRGAGNSSYLLPVTARVVAGVAGVSVVELAQEVSATAERLYGPW
ncbi:MAG TPA: TatD family hydrolase [Tetrasphaera sp.]|uniref:TatD family hydrolase n=1 Tax=Nostocoides sp. TaxID=1917966 RepID=UPI002C985291|nr:TatD family hydrolase [Tetrasphaera sp.]HNQ05828.1 TatD family hydrolase [Tetrasphaera sp.]